MDVSRGNKLIICPECSEPVRESDKWGCSSCGWNSAVTGGVLTAVRASDWNDPTLKSYFSNYDDLAEVDLKQAIVDEGYVRGLARNLVDRAGDVHGLSVCDLGSGKGFAARMLAAAGARVTAVDISAAYLKTLIGEANLQPILANAENLPFRHHFDLIVSTDVMEHVLNLGSFLFCVNRGLKVGGRFLVRVPYREDLITYSPHRGCPYRFVHLRTFNKGSLQDCLIQSGFKIRNVRLDGFFWGKPQPFWRRTASLVGAYTRIQKYAVSLGFPDQIVMRLNPLFLSPLMQPSMILADTEKIRDIE